MCKICLKLTIQTPERRQRCLSGVFIVNFEQILHTVVSIADSEEVNAGYNWTVQKVLKFFMQSLKNVKNLMEFFI